MVQAETIGDRIKKLREDQGFTQSQFVYLIRHRHPACRLNQPYLSALEAGKHTPTLRILGAIAEVLGVGLDELGR